MHQDLSNLLSYADKFRCQWTLSSDGRATIEGLPFRLEVDTRLLGDEVLGDAEPGPVVVKYKPALPNRVLEFDNLEQLDEDDRMLSLAINQLSGLRSLLRDIRVRASRY
jgi:hypothetical protein